MCDPRLMCRSHLLGEHREMHALVGIVARGTSLDGYVTKGLIETASIQARHDALAAEMESRGYHHYTPMAYVDTINRGVVNTFDALVDLCSRCQECMVGLEMLSSALGKAVQ